MKSYWIKTIITLAVLCVAYIAINRQPQEEWWVSLVIMWLIYGAILGLCYLVSGFKIEKAKAWSYKWLLVIGVLLIIGAITARFSP